MSSHFLPTQTCRNPGYSDTVPDGKQAVGNFDEPTPTINFRHPPQSPPDGGREVIRTPETKVSAQVVNGCELLTTPPMSPSGSSPAGVGFGNLLTTVDGHYG